MKDTVTNFYKQANRINASSRIGGKKGGKKGQFAPTLRRILEAGGRNKTDLRCNGVSKSSGSQKLTNLTATLENCETKINMSCNTANFPMPNMTQVATCLTTMATFESMVEVCMKLTGAEGCNCWVNSTFESLASTIRSDGCKIYDASLAMVAQLTYCRKNFTQCKTSEDESLKTISACSQSSEKMLLTAKALTANSAGLTAAKETAARLINSTSRRRSRASATSCDVVISTISTLIILAEQKPASPSISVLAKDVTNVTVTCNQTEKESLNSQVSSLESTLVIISDELSTIQEDLQTATGTTASSVAIANATSSTESTCISTSTLATDNWCTLNCNHEPPYCPAGLCLCTGDTDTSTNPCYSTDLLTTDDWCTLNCNHTPSYCPAGLCTCTANSTTASSTPSVAPSTTVASSARRNIVARHLMNRFNLN